MNSSNSAAKGFEGFAHSPIGAVVLVRQLKGARTAIAALDRPDFRPCNHLPGSRPRPFAESSSHCPSPSFRFSLNVLLSVLPRPVFSC